MGQWTRWGAEADFLSGYRNRNRSGVPRTALVVAALGVAVLLAATFEPASAQDVGKDASNTGARRNSDIRTPATYVENRPSIDGVLDEPFWQTIEPITDFLQRLPNEGAEPTEASEVRIGYDGDNLYFGFMLYDSEPEKIKRTILKREGFIPQDDFIYIALDSYNDDRNGYLFELNSLGTQGDALITDESSVQWNWEGVFETQGQVTSEGWVLEVAIPFKTIRFDPGEPLEMGIAFARGIVRKNERVYWPLIDLDYKTFSGLAHASQFATLVGLRNVRPGRNLEIKPYLLGGAQKANLGFDGMESDTDGDFGLDVKYGITSNLTLDMTYNTDFAQVEADNVQVNLTRFSLRFPEKREFFLERAGLFSFGTRGAETFFSRRIGITNDILAGGRVTGQAGPISIGVLDIQTRDQIEEPGTNFGVARIRGDLAPGFTIGGILTNRDDRDGHNRAVGGDLVARFWSGSTLDAWTTSVWSSEGDGRSSAGAVDLKIDTDLYVFELGYMNVGDDFDPGIGFVRRMDMIRYSGKAGISPRIGRGDRFVRQVSLSAGGEYIQGQDHEKQTTDLGADFSFSLENTDRGGGGLHRRFERLEVPFQIQDDVMILAGDYTFTTGSFNYRPNWSRPLAGSLSFSYGGFFGGTRTTFGGGPTVKFSKHLEVRLTANHNVIRLPVANGDFSTTILGANILTAINRKIFAEALIQYDNDSKKLQANLRVNWIHTPGSDLFLVFNTGYFFQDGLNFRESALDQRTGLVKLTYLWAL